MCATLPPPPPPPPPPSIMAVRCLQPDPDRYQPQDGETLNPSINKARFRGASATAQPWPPSSWPLSTHLAVTQSGRGGAGRGEGGEKEDEICYAHYIYHSRQRSHADFRAICVSRVNSGPFRQCPSSSSSVRSDLNLSRHACRPSPSLPFPFFPVSTLSPRKKRRVISPP